MYKTLVLPFTRINTLITRIYMTIGVKNISKYLQTFKVSSVSVQLSLSDAKRLVYFKVHYSASGLL